jgi:hypothetical protein
VLDSCDVGEKEEEKEGLIGAKIDDGWSRSGACYAKLIAYAEAGLSDT